MPIVKITQYLRDRVQVDKMGELLSTSVSLAFVPKAKLKNFLNGSDSINVTEQFYNTEAHKLYFEPVTNLPAEDNGGGE
jgi:hypothetical protein